MRRNVLLFNLTLLMSILFLFPQASFAADGAPSFGLQLNNNQVTLGKEIQVTITGTNLTDVYAFELNLDFDSTRLKYMKSESRIADGFPVELKPVGNQLQFAFTKVGDISGENGTRNLATVTFVTIGQGNPAIQLKSVKLVDSQLNVTTPTTDAKVTASIIGGNPGSNPGNSTPGTNVNPSNGQPGQGTLTPDVKLDAATKTAKAVVNEAAWDQAVQQAAPNEKGVKNIQISSKEVPGANAYELQLPTTAFANSENTVQVQVVSPLATVLISNHMFKAGEIAADGVKLRIEKADISKLDMSVLSQIGDRPVIDISLHAGDQTISWNNPEAPVTVTLPYSPNAEELRNPEHIVVWYLSGEGKVVSVPNGRYDAKTGTVTFKTTHFSNYAIAFVQKTFNDIVSLDWAKKQIEVLASKGIINGISDKSFDPGQPVTRADFIVLLVRTLELESSKGMGNRFADVQEGDYYNDALRIARGLGITKGMGDNLFKPHMSITREDMMVLTERALEAVKPITTNSEQAPLKLFKDSADISDYAVNSVAALVKTGLVQGNGNTIHPKKTTTRAESAVLMYNIYAYLYK
ncbi:S-layer homology domain-containing protein [Paenibacillus sp. LHD-38]|uniref:S-layer homology domain-containing protein n=1 Tax=Paenibacillus sp. LHD-38 TaxID=3072143 RepID=UPI00280D8C27|nr:S-layer homology domain-containing protein [Paenibacillus sp. LHD-38]MDQ8737251.1 S-layer homology domain-containing protein [Paenibacillus sp. LHD-38]